MSRYVPGSRVAWINFVKLLQISIPVGRTGYGIAIRAISRLMANAAKKVSIRDD